MLTWKIKNYTTYSDYIEVEWEVSVTVNNNTALTFGKIGLPIPNEIITDQVIIDLVKQKLGTEEIALFETVLTAQAQGGNP